VTEIGDHCVRRLLCVDGHLAEALCYRLLRTTVRLVRGLTTPDGDPDLVGEHSAVAPGRWWWACGVDSGLAA
jgi:hypothetical protein